MELISKDKTYSEDQWVWLNQITMALTKDEIYTIYSVIDMGIYKEKSLREKCDISPDDKEAIVNKKINTLTTFRNFLESEM